MNPEDDIQVKVRKTFSYNEVTGILTRRKLGGLNGGRGSNGTLMSNGYLIHSWEGKNHLVARLVWVYVYGDWPKSELDHKNGIKTDNRVDNLREVTRQENNLNRLVCKSPYKGIVIKDSRGKTVFVARLTRMNKPIYLGTFNSLKEAQDSITNYQRLHDTLVCTNSSDEIQQIK